MVTAEPSRAQPTWLSYADLGCAAAAGALWCTWPQLGAWPFLLGLLPWGLRLVVTGRLSKRTAFDLPLALFLLLAGVGIWAAYDRTAAWAKFWLVVGAVLLFYAFVNAEPIGNGRVWLLALFGAGVALYFLATNDWHSEPAKIPAFTRLGQAIQAPLPPVHGQGLHPNVAGGTMAMMLPFAGCAALQAWKPAGPAGARGGMRTLRRVAGTAALLITAFGLALSTSRSAWLALAGALLLAALWSISRWRSRGRTRGQAWIFPGLVSLALVGVMGLELAWPGWMPSILAGSDTAIRRGELLGNSLTLMQDYPFQGAGLGGFDMLFSSYVLLRHDPYIAHSHNLFLNVAIEQGLPSLLLLMWIGALFGLAVWRGMVGGEERRGKGALGAAALSLVIVGMQGLMDDVLYSSGGLLLPFVPLAFATAFLQPKPTAARRWWNLTFPLLVVLVMALALFWQKPLLSRLLSNMAAVQQSQIELEVYPGPEYPIQDAVRRGMDLSGPVARYERALALDPQNASANRRLGQIELSLGAYGTALQHLEAAYEADPGSGTVRQLLGEAYLAEGRLAEGQALWAQVRNRAGRQLDTRVYWYYFIGDMQRAAWMAQAAECR